MRWRRPVVLSIPPFTINPWAGSQESYIGPTEERVLGILQYRYESTRDVIEAPTWGRAGEHVVVTIRSFGRGCERAGGAGVLLDREAASMTASIMVYDFTTATRPNVVCPMILQRLVHPVVVRFDAPGRAAIRVWGRRRARSGAGRRTSRPRARPDGHTVR